MEVKLPTIWRDEKAVSREKSQKIKDQKKEDAGARKGRKVAKHSTLRQLAHTRLYSHILSSTCHHTTCSHTIQLTHNSTHTTCSHTTLLTQLYSHCYLFTQLVITQFAHTQDWLPSFHVAGVVLGDIDFHFAWQAWHLWHWTGSGGALGPEWPGWPPRLLAWQAWHFATSTFVSRGRRGTWWHRPSLCVAGVAHMALGWLRWRAWAGMVAVTAAAVGVAGVALWDIHLGFTWQAWYLVTSTFTLCGRRGTYGIGLAPVARVGRSGWGGRRECWRGRRGTWRHPPSFHVAGVVLGDIDLHFVWQAWHVWHWAGSGGARGPEWPGWPTSTFVSRGRRGTWWHRPSLCVAGVARIALGWLQWRAWAGVAGVAAAAVGVAGVALCDIHLRFTWQVWYVVTSTFTLCGRRGTLCFVLHGRCGTCHTQLCHTACFATPSFTHQFVTHHLSHTTLSHALFHTHNFHTTLSHTMFDTPLCHTPSFTPLCHTPSLTHHLLHTISHTHKFVTHHLWHHLLHTTLSPTISLTHHLSHTIFDTPSLTHHVSHHACDTPSFTYNFVTHSSSHTICFTSRSSTTSFVFPSFPVPLQHLLLIIYWKKMTCGVIRSFNLLLFLYSADGKLLLTCSSTWTAYRCGKNKQRIFKAR